MYSTSDSEEERMASVFDVLDEIRQRPGMYVGSDDSRRLQNLEQLLFGYSLALRQHHIQEPVVDFVRELGAYIWRTREWSASCGPAAAIRAACTSDQEAWETFWTLVDEFRIAVLRSQGVS